MPTIHATRAPAARILTVALVGNPNAGKTSLFNSLTGHHQRIGNYPGVTVEKKIGKLRGSFEGRSFEIIDLPGAYSLSPASADEAIMLDVLLGKQAGAVKPDVILVVLDATNLARNLFLLSQLLEIGTPVVAALNMMDLAEAKKISIDIAKLSAELGIRVVPVVATKGRGVAELKHVVVEAVEARPSTHCASFPDCVCAELDGLSQSVAQPEEETNGKVVRLELLQTLLDPGGFHEKRLVAHCGKRLADELAQRRQRIRQGGESVVEVEAKIRYAWIDRVVATVVSQGETPHYSRTERVDHVLTHPVVGLLILMAMMGLCFQSIFTWAQPIMLFIEKTVAAFGGVVFSHMPEGAIRSLVVDGAIAGVGAVLVFLPQILILFFFIAILEDCGYMARAAFLFDRWMNLIGLNGKSFIPLLSSFACAVPGIMATRTIEDRRDRLITMLIAPLMSCSARLPVYVLLIAAFVPATSVLGGWVSLHALTLLAMYLVGVVVAVPVALLLQKTMFKGERHAFLMELPTYKWPTARTVFFRLYDQARAFVGTAGTMIFAVTVVVWALGYYPRPAWISDQYGKLRHSAHLRCSNAPSLTEAASLRHELEEIDREESGAYLRASFLGRMGHVIEPVVRPLGWDWRIGTAVVASFPAREVVIATMGTIYNLGGDEDETSLGLRDQLKAAQWPDGRPVFNLASALSIMVFFALCCQCGATLAVIKRETKTWRWPLFTFTYMTALAYVAALITYQVASRLI